MNLKLPPSLRVLAKAVQEKGYTLYVVGGAVRNALLGLPSSDIDICSQLLSKDVMKLCEELGYPAIEVNPRLNTLHIELDGETVEYTAFRSESYSQGGSHEPQSVEVGVDINTDALRRDFSVNALYYNILTGEVTDPTSKGLADIKRRRLSTTTKDPAIIMKDDALRMLRLCRFTAELGFNPDPEVVKFVRNNSKLIHDASMPRVFHELERLLLADTKYEQNQNGRMPAHKRGLLALNACGLLTELIPEFAHANEMGKCIYHRHSVLFHSINTCALMPPTVELRLAGLLHDIAKPKVYLEQGNMHGHDVEGEMLAYNRMIALCVPNKIAKNASQIVRWHMYDLTGRAKESTIRKKVCVLGKEFFEKLIVMRTADVVGSGKLKPPVATAQRFRAVLDNIERENAPTTLKELNISGQDLARLGLKGKQIGEMLEALLAYAVCKPDANTLERLVGEVRRRL